MPSVVSIFEVIQVGVGPSASHTVGPMRAARDFVTRLLAAGVAFDRLRVELQGSLGATGKGHLSDGAVLAGLSGYVPDNMDSEVIPSLLTAVNPGGNLILPGRKTVDFGFSRDMVYAPKTIAPYHNNSLLLQAFWGQAPVFSGRYYSTGGGFVTRDDRLEGQPGQLTSLDETRSGGVIPHPYSAMSELVDYAQDSGKSLYRIIVENELATRTIEQIEGGLDNLSHKMGACIDRGCQSMAAILPGGLGVPRRAHALYLKLSQRDGAPGTPAIWRSFAQDPMRVMDWVNLWALAVNEENAAGGQVVRAPTNGSAGIVPAVGRYLTWFCPRVENHQVEALREYLTVAGAIGGIIKTNASVAGAEVGCQGEVGSAASMAAGGLAAALGGTPPQIENAAEIAMEHHLGLTCDPIGGLVQVPCIERNAVAAMQAINAARISLWGDGKHRVSFDEVVQTMLETGLDMNSKYKETALGGLAVNVVEC
ncbi:L-serine ammonia-lyase [Mobiluncus mulieris]|uniref:L-serine dehydratase n=1 Tax=Mobiluncus mulieris TaxID=2052 RepID=A0ABD4TUS3_9ACTO|nr:L-serine ammonia-lyase [Mobiluncus mulieris]MCU9968179.1 L-serine ammonia-lyase [Mobiluncus mulieris]MCU9972358.1 L-serine ammonia-lyase [Mobiluncus mulieris]MCV0008448.1 L-serine ammonia-lyase [Mobiluncus mulieris]NMW74495.1 L-serine ammonia-lyase [Mobiluncus mulieris]